ncbi:hypothetical protein B0J17DRAFT_636807 [Rhizoctonia solani]|nr:hypothetical protein B0J17DRAFT_636807 [Rhizoctonia solani]
MNSPRSVAMGWVGLLAAGGVTFYYAKKRIDQKRKLYKERKPTRTTEIKDYTPNAPITSTNTKS